MSGLVFIRHAETDMAGTFCGHSDPPINTRGREQLQTLSADLAAETFAAVYSSDLRRAVETAKSLSLACIETSLLREIDFGKWEGLTWVQIEEQDPAYARRWLAEFPALPAPEGEPFASFEQRVLQQVNQLLSLAEEKRIAVVTHAGVMRIVLRAIMGHSEQEAWTLTKPYCSWFVCSRGASRIAIAQSPASKGEQA